MRQNMTPGRQKISVAVRADIKFFGKKNKIIFTQTYVCPGDVI